MTTGPYRRAAPPVGVLALQGGVAAHTRALVVAGAAPRPVRRPEDLDGLAGVVLPGGESTTMSALLRRHHLDEPLRQLADDGIPVLGTCAGMVLLADRLLDGATGQTTLARLDVTVRRNAFGRQLHSFETDLDVTDLDAPFPGVFIRAPWVEEVGPRAVVLATAGDHRSGRRVVAVRQDHVLATAFHPELSHDPRVHGLLVGLARG